MIKKLNILIAAMAICMITSACSPVAQKEDKPENSKPVSVAMLKGPTGIGALELMEKNSNGKTKQNYNISLKSSPDEVTAGLINGELQIAALPSNVAAMLYEKTGGDIHVAAINTLGVLYLLERGDTIQSIQDLAGKTVYISGQGATPEYALQYLLDKNGVENVTLQFMQDHAELGAAIASGKADIALLPEPNVTAVLMQSPETRIAIDLNKEWEKLGDGSALTMGCIAVRKDFYEENPESLAMFLDEYNESVNYVNNNVKDAAALAEKFEVIPKAAVAEKAIPNCALVFITGEEMEKKLSGFYEVLYQFNPKAIGGKLPDEAFYSLN